MKKKYAAAGILVLFILLSGVGIGISLNRGNKNARTEKGITLDKEAESYEDNEDMQPEQQSIRFPGYPEITIKKGQDEIPVVLTNPEVNPCYFRFSVSLDGETPLYESDWVEPGAAISGFRLQEDLSPGDYEMCVSIATKSLETQEDMNGGKVKTVLHVTE